MRKKIKRSLITGIASIAFGLGVFGICDASINNNIFLAKAASETDYTMEFVAGASVRTTPDSMGIRYTANFGSSIYELVQSGDENAEVGIIIVPEKALANTDSSTDYFDYLAQNFGKSKESISTSFRAHHFTANDDGTYKATASIINIKDNNLALEYQAVTYYTLDNVNYVYSSKSDARTISYVANAALQSNALSETQREDTLETSIVLSDRLEKLGKTSQSDFTVNTTVGKGLDLTPYISNGRTIDTVTFNGVERNPDANNVIVLTEADEVAQTHTIAITYNEKATVDVEEQVEALVEETPTENSSVENATEDISSNTLNLVLSVGIEQDVTVYMGLENSSNFLTKNDVFGYNSSQTIEEIKDQRNRTVSYDNTLEVEEAIQLPSGLTAGREYVWKISDGNKFYFINVFVATNVIRSWSDFSGLFTSTQGSTYYTHGADGYYVLANDIDASGEIHTHPYVDMNGVGLTGTFDGLGHTIDGLTIASYADYTRDDTPKYSGGLFANITRGEVKNLNVTNMKFTSEEIGGEGIGLAKYIKNSVIKDVSLEITEVSSNAWANFALAYETPAILGHGRTFLTNVTIEMLPKASNTYVLGNSVSLADGCKYTNVQITSNNRLFRKDVTLKDEDVVQITHITWVSSDLPQYLFTTAEEGYQKTAEFDAYVLHNGGVSTQNVEVLFSNPNVVSYENDTITALENGETTVSLRYYNTANEKTYTIELGVITVVEPVIETDKYFYFGTADTDNRLFVSDFAPNNTTFEIETITDNNGVSIGYDKATGIVTVPNSVDVGEEYTWTLDNGYYEYTVNVFVATNVIKTIDDLDALFNYSASKDYYNTGASGYYVLANNIDASRYTHNHGKTDSSGQGLKGTFDGRGYAIDGITLTNAGLFGYVQGGAIKNVALTNVTVQSSDEAYVITRQSGGMTIDNVFISVAYTEDSSSWNQGLFEKAWGAVSVSNVMVVATGGNANAFAVGAAYESGNPANYTYTNVYAISALGAVRVGEATGITIYADVATFKANVTTSSLTNFNEYWNLDGDYPVFINQSTIIDSGKTIYVGLNDEKNPLNAEDIFGAGTDKTIQAVMNEKGVEIPYYNGYIHLPDELKNELVCGSEYTWRVSDGKTTYTVTVVVATNVIRTTADLKSLFTYSTGTDYYETGANGYYILANDIDASGYTHTHGKTDSGGIGLTGTFDGRGHAINGITFTNAGLFGFVSGGTIKDLALTNVKVKYIREHDQGERCVITRQSGGMTIDNMFVSVEYDAETAYSQGLFAKAWGTVSVSNLVAKATVAEGKTNDNAFAICAAEPGDQSLGIAGGNPWNYTYTNVYAISTLASVRDEDDVNGTILSEFTPADDWAFLEYWND